jgi:hypothetical protein
MRRHNLFYKFIEGGLTQRPLKLFFAAVLAVFVLGGCASFSSRDAGADPVGLLPPEKQFYSIYTMAAEEDLLETLLHENLPEADTLSRVLEKTDSIYLSSGIQTPDGPDVQAASWPDLQAAVRGEYPRGAYAFSMNTNPRWKRAVYRSAGSSGRFVYWSNPEEGLFASVPDRRTMLFATGNIEQLLDRAVFPETPVLPAEYSRNSPPGSLYLYVPAPSADLLEKLTGRPLKVPVTSIEIFVLPEDGGYVIEAVFALASAKDARTFAVLAKLLVLKLIKDFELFPPEKQREALQKIKIEADGDKVTVSGLLLSREKLRGLIKDRLSLNNF